MTAPVYTAAIDPAPLPAGQATMKMAFYLPSKYSKLEDLPRPNNPAVKLVVVPPRRYAVTTFSGSTDEDRTREIEMELRARLAADGVALAAHNPRPALWRYNPPWTLPFARTNELAIELPAI